MTNEEAIELIKVAQAEVEWSCPMDYAAAFDLAIKVLEQEPCEDAISREAVIDMTGLSEWFDSSDSYDEFVIALSNLPPVTPQPKTGRCKDCKHFEYDSVAKVDGVPLIVAHEICSRWGDGCKTSEDGYCFLFEPKMQEVQE